MTTKASIPARRLRYVSALANNREMDTVETHSLQDPYLVQSADRNTSTSDTSDSIEDSAVFKPPVSYVLPEKFSTLGELRNTEDAGEDEEQGESIYDGVHEAHLSEHHEERDRINICVRKYITVDYEEIMKKYPKLTKEDIKDYQIEFKLLDLNQDGLLDFDELSQLLDNIGDGSSREKRQLLFQEIDVDNSGLLDFDEFLTLMDILAGKPKTEPEDATGHPNIMAEYFMRAGEINRRIRRMNLFDQLTNKLF